MDPGETVMKTKQADFSEARMMAFGEKLVGELATMFFANMAYIGEKLGLFQSMARSGPVTTQQLAEVTSLQARYLQEWLSAMSAAGWIEYDAESRRFTLPPEHAVFFAQTNHPMYMGGALEALGAYGQTIPKIIDCFRNGGGISLSEQHPDVPRITERLSAPLFQNFLTKVWIAQLLPDVHQKLSTGAEVADVGCGAGRALVEMAHAYPRSHFSGYEPDFASAKRARRLVEEVGVKDRVRILNAPSSEMLDQQYDFVTTFEVVHDLANPQSLIEDVRRALKPDGTYLMMEANCSHRLEENLHPIGKLFYSLSTLYCLPYSLAQNGAGIGTCMGEELPRQMCSKAGFSQFRKLNFDHPLEVLYEVRV